MLRAAQNASVVSNTSSTSAGLPDTADTNHLLSGPSHPAPSQRRHQRSSSSTSTRSITAVTNASISTVGGISGSITSGAPSSTADRTRGNVPRHDSIPQTLSRQNSMTSSRPSGASSPAPLSSAQSSYQHPEPFPYFYQQRPGMPQFREPSTGNVNTLSSNTPDLTRQESATTSVQTTGRYEETAYHRNELEGVKRENEILKRRIRELERTLRARRQSDASRTRSESVSTTASINVGQSQRDGSGIGRGRERDKDAEDDVVGVGESARSSRLR